MRNKLKDQPPENLNHFWIIGIFLFLGIVFLCSSCREERHFSQHHGVDKKLISTELRRKPFLAAKTMIDGDIYSCNDCHQDMEPSEKGHRKFVEDHEYINLNHGINDRCYNCHDKYKRERLVDIYGNEILFEKSEELCHKCHGPKYRDWVAGVHGRVNGYWDKDQGEQRKAKCVSCHDPHDPKYKPMKPLPAPHKSH